MMQVLPGLRDEHGRNEILSQLRQKTDVDGTWPKAEPELEQERG